MATISLPAQLARTWRFTLGVDRGRAMAGLLLLSAGHQVMDGAVTWRACYGIRRASFSGT